MTLLGLLGHPRVQLLVVLLALKRAYEAKASTTALDSYAKATTTVLPKRLRLLFGDLLGVYLAYESLRFLIKKSRDVRMLKKSDLVDYFGGMVVDVAKALPFTKQKVDEEMAKLEKDLRKSIKGENPEPADHLELPNAGKSHDEIVSRLLELQAKDAKKWENGRVSGGVYHGGDDMLALQAKAYEIYNVSNPLHSDLWPSIMRMEAEVLSMTSNMLNGGDSGVCGVITSGGTESIMLATKMHRDYFREKFGITRPEIVCAVTAHAAIDKACHTMDIKLLKAKVDPVTFKVDLNSVKSLMSADTIMIYSSAPHFPHGIIDDVPALSEIAQSYGCGLHVDCCLGGFVLPFLNKLGGDYAVGDFDFACPGVTSISCDTHKYGFAAKGTSVMLARSKEWRHYAFSKHPQWTGGLYVTPTFAGSKAGALSACCWSAMVSMGEQGYKDSAKTVVDAARKVRNAIDAMEGLDVMGDPQAMIVAFKSDVFDIYALGDLMTQKGVGWSLNMLQHPACAHLCVTLPVARVVDEFISELGECCEEMIKRSKGLSKHEGSAPIYGLAASAPAGPLADVLCIYTDTVLST